MAPARQADPARYGNAWAAIVQLVRDGYSWSGHERNRLLLNCGDGTFADLSTVTGLDHDGDGRALAVVDWDQDGDLDLCFRDRTAPRLRLMLNQHAPPAGARDFVAVKLVGVTCNRDAIGAVVEVVVEGAAGALVKSVRAGDLFLSQSSRWLHFGLADTTTLREVRVQWPGGERESFTGARAGGFFLLEQGTGLAVAHAAAPRRLSAATSKPPDRAPSSSARIVLPAKIPLPPLGFRDAAGQPAVLVGEGAPRLVLLWSSSCPHCHRALTSLVSASDRLREPGLEVVALSVDVGGSDFAETGHLLEALRWPFRWGVADSGGLDRLAEFQRALFDVTVPLAVPLALLCDRNGNVAAIYRGGFEATVVLDDLKAVAGADQLQCHALAPPLAGRWFTKPVDPVFALEFMAREFETRLPEDALFYLEAAMRRANGQRQVALRDELVRKHAAHARRYKSERQPDLAAAHFESALAHGPQAELCHDYGTMLASYGELTEARAHLERALTLDPNLVPAQKALAMVNKLIAEGH